ncbi:MAG: hypothetical protein PHW33_01510 [Candidatus Portnoybacteria bacterium]|jgi:hypothetical protein|nr:hypothetical protein [Candidatus Portnoybacteria bacterium]
MNLPVKIKKNIPPSSNQPTMPSPPEKSRPAKKLVWWLLAAILAETLTVGYFLLWPPDCSPYEKLLPENNAGVFYFKPAAMISLAKNLTAKNFSWLPLAWAQDKTAYFLSKAPAGLANRIAEYFQDEAALVVLPGDSVPPAWLILTRQKTGEEKITAALSELKNSLKQNFNVLEETYRHLTIIQIKPLGQENNGCFLVSAQGYFLFSNQRDLLKDTLDKLIE